MRLFAYGLSSLRSRARQLFSQSRKRNKTVISAIGRDLVRASDEILNATPTSQPIVAIESSLYTHEWPFPESIQLALHLQDLIRKNGAIPATIGVVDGMATIGLTDRDIVNLCFLAEKSEIMRVSRGELPYILGMGLAGRPLYGGTTSSASMFLARWFEIPILVTGGIDGINCSGEYPHVISPDVTELRQTPAAVISSGCKLGSNIQKTFEQLESHGVLVATFADGRDGDVDLPAFYSRNSGIKSPLIIQNAHEAAAILIAQGKLGCKRNRYSRPGVLFANPIPEEFSVPNVEIERAFDEAVSEAKEKSIHGHDFTSFISARIKTLTQSRSESAYRALLESNVIVAAKTAVEYSLLLNKYEESKPKEIEIAPEPQIIMAPRKLFHQHAQTSRTLKATRKSNLNADFRRTSFPRISYGPEPRMHGLGPTPATSLRETLLPELNQKITSKGISEIIVIGAVAINLSCDLILNHGENLSLESQLRVNTPKVARIEPTIGGTGYNIACAAQTLNKPEIVKLCSLVADDITGKMVLSGLMNKRFDISGIKIVNPEINSAGVKVPNHTAQLVAVSDRQKDLVLGMGDMQIFRQNPYNFQNIPSSSKWAIIDAHWKPRVVRWLMRYLRMQCPGIKIAYEPVDPKIGPDLFRTSFFQTADDDIANSLRTFPNHLIDLVTPNASELNEMFLVATDNGYFKGKDHWNVLDGLGILETQSKERYQDFLGKEFTDPDILFQSIRLLPYMPTILTKLGPKGVLLTELLRIGDPRLEDPDHAQWIFSRSSIDYTSAAGVYVRLFPPTQVLDPIDIVNKDGAGDTFLGILVTGLNRMINLDEHLINIAHRGAVMALKCKQAISPSLASLLPDLDELCLKPKVRSYSRNHEMDHTTLSALVDNHGPPQHALHALIDEKSLDDFGIKTPTIDDSDTKKMLPKEHFESAEEVSEEGNKQVSVSLDPPLEESANISEESRGKFSSSPPGIDPLQGKASDIYKEANEEIISLIPSPYGLPPVIARKESP